jgi:hypothetical protein
MFNIKTCNAISPKGLSRFAPARYEVAPDVAAPASLLAVARAGAGV